ncbi:MAG: hypothetical protein HY558_04825 [Euryarchaeota archaeon]|nr:hypothetical protein [Euryarchaeota archaeon]
MFPLDVLWVGMGKLSILALAVAAAVLVSGCTGAPTWSLHDVSHDKFTVTYDKYNLAWGESPGDNKGIDLAEVRILKDGVRVEPKGGWSSKSFKEGQSTVVTFEPNTWKSTDDIKVEFVSGNLVYHHAIITPAKPRSG